MKIEQLSPNGFKLENVFDSELLAEISLRCDTFVPWQTRRSDTSKREVDQILDDELRVSLAKLFNPVTKTIGLGIELWRDYPGYTNPYHIDDPQLQNIIIVYLGSEELETGTGYIEETHFKIPYKKNTGIMLFNSDKIMHGMVGQVPGDIVRKSLYINWNNRE